MANITNWRRNRLYKCYNNHKDYYEYLSKKEKVMKLSSLQKYILKTTLQNNKPRVSRIIFEQFYDNIKKAPVKKIRANIITKSIERLIDKGLLTGFGEKTQHKLFIQQIKLTSVGKKNAQALLGKQTQLPFSSRHQKK